MSLTVISKSEPELVQYLKTIDKSYRIDPIDLPVWVAGSADWEIMEHETRNLILGGMLSKVVARAKHVPYFRDNPDWEYVRPDDIDRLSDLHWLPVMAKDDIPGTAVTGFRAVVNSNPGMLVHENLDELIRRQEKANPDYATILVQHGGQKIFRYGSGGTQGQSTTTILTYIDMHAEELALARCLTSNGLNKGNNGRILCLYNDTHKGGFQLKQAAQIMGMEFHSRAELMDWLKQKPKYSNAVSKLEVNEQLTSQQFEDYSAVVRAGIRDFITEYGIEVIESVQPPPEFLSSNAKGGNLAFMKIYEEGPSSFRNVKEIFLTGFPVDKKTCETLMTYDPTYETLMSRVSTTAGSTEAMAWGTTKNILGDVNDLKSAHFPTVALVARYSGYCVPNLSTLSPGTEGLVFLTALSRAGSVYINLFTGDFATKTQAGLSGVHRYQTTNIAGSCALDALAL
ncbi:hypothetical protein HYU11_02405 [Candidatus Woesearchaeota archaeon]|nr:hypothetical protein [Candidatus Woesearchaeota archaeon]